MDQRRHHRHVVSNHHLIPTHRMDVVLSVAVRV